MRLGRLLFFAWACLLGCGGASSATVAPEDAVEDSSVAEASPPDAVSPGPDAADPPPTSATKDLVVEPDDGSGPILAAIAGATKSIHLEVYLLTDDTVVTALKKAKAKGVDVQVILEQKPFGLPGANDAAQASLSAAGIPVRWANGALYTLTHAKFMVIDGKTLVVMTMNLSKSAFTTNREYAVFDVEPADVAEAEAIFAADAAGASSLPMGALVVSPTNAESRLLSLIDSATKSIDVEMETLGDSKIDDRLIAAAGRGVAVRVLVANSSSSTTASSVARLGGKGIAVRKVTGTLSMHAKAIVVDRVRAYVGSQNLTVQSLVFNRELGVITDTSAVVGRIASTIEADYAKGVPY